MDLLKRELQKKREAATEEFAGKSFVRRSELEHKQLQKRRKVLANNASAPVPYVPDSSATPSSPDAEAGNPSPSSTSAAAGGTAAAAAVSKKTTQEEESPLSDLPRHEVARRLRVLREPVTLFGEDDAARAERLRLVLKCGVADGIGDLDMTRGQTNDFLRDLTEMRKRHRAGREGKRARGGTAGGRAHDADATDADRDSESSRMMTTFEELCKEDRILVFFKRLLDEWKQELDGMTELEKRTANGKIMLATCKQCERYLSPLFELCRKKVLPNDIRGALHAIVECCMKRDYLAAMEQYVKLAIGNKPWPIGVTMVGIHERSAREKINTGSVAHIMNHETTRRYLQSIKRLMTLCEPRYPAPPLKMSEKAQ